MVDHEDRKDAKMKVLNAGCMAIGKWWIWLVLECEICGRKIELEKDDDKHSLFMHQTETSKVEVMCECCGSIMVLKKDNG